MDTEIRNWKCPPSSHPHRCVVCRRLAQLVERQADRQHVHRRQFPAHTRDLRFRLGPLAAHPEELGSMDPAHAQEHHRAIETLAPSRRRVGPLLGAAKICQLVAHAHQLAVDASGVGGTDAAGDDRQHRLVEHCETVSDIALLDQRDALADQRVRTQRLVLVASTDRGNRPGRLDGAVEVAGGERLVDRQRLQIAVLHALRLALEQPLRLADPPRTHRLLARRYHEMPMSIANIAACRGRRSSP
jgi:hypothetical protein